MDKILVTGGIGYIGSHTVVDLIENGYEAIIVDDGSRSSSKVLDGIEKIVGKRPEFYKIDICDKEKFKSVFETEGKIAGIIHFAAYKFVDESVENPLMYYRNNLTGLLNVIELANNYMVENLVFSSSCSVYGEIKELPVSENSKMMPIQSPYARTKLMGEDILEDMKTVSPVKYCSLRYFNPVGAHGSGHIGESPLTIPNNLVPRITAAANGKMDKLKVWGHDYPTRDGTCIRDYIHVSDIAEAHTLALKYLEKQTKTDIHEIINLGSGEGVTVLELLSTFEKVTGIKLNYELSERREGDVVAVYSDSSLALKLLNWSPKRTTEDMMRSAWNWEKTNS